MPVWVGFLRAVNLGRQRQVPMRALRTLLETEGYTDVETHIQSGNVKLRSPTRSVARMEGDLRRLISAEFGFDVPVVVRTPGELGELVRTVEALESPITGDAKRYVTFMTGDLDAAGIAALHDWDVATEGARVIGNDIVLFLSDGVQGSKLSTARIEKLTGAVGTARGLSVVRAVVDKWCGGPGGPPRRADRVRA